MTVYNIAELTGKGINFTYEAFEAVNERFIKSNEIGVSARNLNYYKNKGLLFSSIKYDKHDHILFSFSDYGWFQIIIKLRKFDIGLSTIKEIKEILDTTVPFDEFMNELKHSERLLSKMPDEIKEDLIELLHSDFDWKEIDVRVPINLISLLLAEAIVTRKLMTLMVTPEGEVYFFSPEDINELNKDDSYTQFLSHTHVSISLTEIIKSFISEFNIGATVNKLMLLDEREALIIRILQEEKIESLTVQVDDKKKINLIETTEKYKIPDKESRLLDMIIAHGYQTIELKTQDGKIVHCKNIRKIKPAS